jgi:hypothetical protein
VASLFGGSISDYVRWTPRIGNTKDPNHVQTGSYVLLACINGNSRFAYIIGAIGNPNAIMPDETYANNLHYISEFNGFRTSVDNNGDINFLRRGATNSDGTLVNTSKTDIEYLSFLDGKVSLAYTNGSDSSGIFLTDVTDVTLTSIKSVTINTSDVNVTAPGGVKINNADEAFVNGTTYRTAENLLNSGLSSSNTALAAAVTTAASALASAAVAMVVPIIGPMIAAPFINTASIAIASMTGLFTEQATLQTQFEANEIQYLSQKNFHADISSTPSEPTADESTIVVEQDTATPVQLEPIKGDTVYSVDNETGTVTSIKISGS